MEALEPLRARIEAARLLRSIVKTMKVLAAVGLRQDQKARASLSDYSTAVEEGLQIALRELDARGTSLSRTLFATEPRSGIVAVVVGSELGMCGQYNDRVARFASARLGLGARVPRKVVAIGERVADRLADLGVEVGEILAAPANPGHSAETTLRRLLALIEGMPIGFETDCVIAYFARRAEGETSVPVELPLLPVDGRRLAELAARPWTPRRLPLVLMEPKELLHACLRELLSISLHAVLIDALECENGARLEAMRAAEMHVEERLGELEARFNNARQEAVTAELLDIVAGVEASSSGKG